MKTIRLTSRMMTAALLGATLLLPTGVSARGGNNWGHRVGDFGRVHQIHHRHNHRYQVRPKVRQRVLRQHRYVPVRAIRQGPGSVHRHLPKKAYGRYGDLSAVIPGGWD